MNTETGMKIAPVILRRSRKAPRGWRWTVLVCPYCGRTHDHGGGFRHQDPRLFLGERRAHCETVTVGQEKGDYLLREISSALAERLRAAAGNGLPYEIHSRSGEVISRHRALEAARIALGKARQLDRWATLLNARLLALGEVLEHLEAGPDK